MTASAFAAAMERLYSASKITTKVTGPKSKPVRHIERMSCI